ncbi:uncharacterized protein PV06_09355 [Exophiala oligosperma]|uniref:Heterokaryon incompatibility domain-containing protein n=1 Tax=Exophiala oligosperma TaxID=215243 RepID=A0A0D2DRN4_9EURO|nr:uncharacterized protein PV06_09355 [Exophiala oligosperma]KIW38384.1 hypothetical protein PV06_09355 [Exophiala oligosperma]
MADSESSGTTYQAEESNNNALCSSCQKLDLSIGKFIISKKGLSRNQATVTDSSGDLANTKDFQLSSGTSRKVFTTFNQAQEKHTSCHFCSLIWQAITRYSRRLPDASTALYLTWEVDGRRITSTHESLVNRTRRIRLSWGDKDGKDESVYLVLVAPTGGRRPNSDAYASFATDTHFLGRGRVDSSEKQALMKSWIDLCAEKHGLRCQKKHGTKSEFKKLIEGTFFGVIDVIDMQLKALPIVNGEPERFVALSYVWGKRPNGEYTYITTRNNVMIHIQHGGLEKAWHRLPKTIQDVILLVSRLGERYVWIDSLCIVQDSLSSWELNAKAMHLVYGNAHFTICAADGEATTGLRAVAPVLRTPIHRAAPVPDRVTTVRFMENTTDRHHSDDTIQSEPISAQILPGIRLLVSRPPEAVIQNSLWNQRGWTFQERLLSRRCLIFAEGHVYFQCRSAVMSQDIFNDGGTTGWSLDWTNSPLRTLGELRRRAFWFYMTCVRLYTGRELTKPKDVLTAFQGTSWLLQQNLNAPLFYGLPVSHFDLALLWMPLAVLDRRRQKGLHRPSNGLCSQDELGNCSCKIEEEGYDGKEFPSWSWCGWVGGKAGYQTEMIEGCLLNVRDWLKHHTWILWYVRDHEGNLRPLWDKKAFEKDVSEDVSWRGYAGRDKSPGQYLARKRSRLRRSRGPSSLTSLVPEIQEVRLDGPGHNYVPTYPNEYPPRGPQPPYYAPPPPPNMMYPPNSGQPYYPPPPGHPPMPAPYGPYPHAPQLAPTDIKPAYILKGGSKSRSRHKNADREWVKRGNMAYLRRLPTGYYDNLVDEEDLSERPREPYVAEGGSRVPSYLPQHGVSLAAGLPRSPYQRQVREPITSRRRDVVSSGASSDGNGEALEDRKSSSSTTGSGCDSDTSEKSSNSQVSIGEFIPVNDATRTDPAGYSEDRTVSDSSDIDSDLYGRSRRSRRHHHRRGRGGSSRKEDAYGRPVRKGLKRGTEFTGILPDNPFGIIRGPFPKDQKDQIRAMPILQFWTWRTELFVKVRGDQEGQTSTSTSMDNQRCQCDIVDKAGDWCGSIVLPRDWIAERQGVPLLFIATSDAKSLTEEECPVWNYYIPKEKDESEWDLYYVLLLNRNRERALWERVGLGKVFQAAFGDAVWDEIKLG